MPWRRRALILTAAVAAMCAVVMIVVHLPVVQRGVWDRVAAGIEESGWRIYAEDLAVRAFPGRLRARGVTVTGTNGTVAKLDRLEARWRWLAVLRPPHRLETVIVEGLHIDVDALPDASSDSEEPSTPSWDLVEIGELQILGAGGEGSIPEAIISVDGLNVAGRLESGMATARLSAESLSLIREGRKLDAGSVDIEARVSQQGLRLDRFVIGSADASVSLAGEVGFSPAITGQVNAEVEFDLPALARWWDPNLVSGLEPEGRVMLEGRVILSDANGVELAFSHHGEPIRIAGYELAELELDVEGGRPRVRAFDPGWGDASVTMTSPGVAEVVAALDDAPVDRALAFVAPEVAETVGSPATLSGQIDGTISYPIVPKLVGGRVDLTLRSPLGRFEIDAEGAGSSWRVADIHARVAGATLDARGTIDVGGAVAADGELIVASPRETVRAVSHWFPALSPAQIDGGPLDARFRVGGSIDQPILNSTVEWAKPVVAGQNLDRLAVAVDGPLDRLGWQIEGVISSTASIKATGTADVLKSSANGGWELRLDDLRRFPGELGELLEFDIGGELIASGSFEASRTELEVDGVIVARDLSFGEWLVDGVEAHFRATQEAIEISGLEGRAYSGTFEGNLDFGTTGLSAPVEAELQWKDIDIGTLPLEVPTEAAGLFTGDLHIEGSLDSPEGDLTLAWMANQRDGLVGEIRLNATLDNGFLTVLSDEVELAGADLSARLEAPLGDLAIPDWLWPDAPSGPVRAEVEFPGFKSGPFVEMFDLEDVPARAVADLRAELAWDPSEPETPAVEVRADNLRLVHPAGELVATGPVEVTVDENSFEMAPVTLVGLGSSIEVSAVKDATTNTIDAHLRARLAPEVSAMLPMPFTVEGPVAVDLDMEAPAARSVALPSVHGRLTIDHTGGRLVMRDPPVEVRDLKVVASLDDAVVDIVEGSAEVNRGRLTIGGGWDPDSAQGVVLEFTGVTTMVAGILSTWNGALAIEPREGRLAHLSGDLTLAAGLRDERFDLTAAMTGGVSTTSADDDLLHDISLDVTVRGRAGIRVENNLGRFDVNWDQLQVGGTAAAPALQGEVRIASGGVLTLPGHEVQVRRGVVEFTGNPEIDPLLEIVPESDTKLYGGEQGVDATELATRGLAQGISSVLGFENETLRPSEIAVQTETDPSVRFMVGQRLSRQLALFLATNLTDVQDRLTMLQYWNIPGLRGLALQGYQDTADESVGANVFQRFEWGGSRELTDRPEIHRLRLEGEWPVSKRSLRRATRLRRGQLYDPFLLFVGEVRMERVLAEHGYQRARVVGVREGNPMSPTLVFSVELGEPQPVVFEGEELPTRVRREVTGLYRRPPRERQSFDKMVGVVRAHVVGEGFITPDISIDHLGDAVVVYVRKGEHMRFEGPFFDGLPVDAVIPAVRALGTAEALALAIDRPDWASRVVGRILRSAGYLEAEVEEIRNVPSDSGTAEVHITVSPGQRATVGTVDLVGDDPLGLTSGSDFAVRIGIPLDRPAIDAATRRLRHAYVDEGYREASVRSTIEPGPEGEWKVEVSLDPGGRRTLRAVHFSGHRDVSEKVLLKGVTLEPGDVLVDRDVNLSASRIANFSPIERDTVEVVPVGSSQADLNFEIEEKKRWTLEVGGGWSSERSFGAAFGARDDNLFGRGIGLNFRGSLDSVERQIFLLGSIPPVPGGRLSFISTIGYRTGDAPDEPDLLSQDQKLASLEASYRLPKSVQVGLYYRWTDTRTYEKVPDDSSPLDLTRVGTLGARTVIERFDYLFDPRSGWGLTSDLGWSGEAIGSDLEYVSWLSGFSLALEPMRNSTWMQALRVGVAEPLKGTSLDREARFFAGGQASVRGFDLNTVGPVTHGIGGGLVPAGGGALFVLNEEIRIPIWDPIRIAVFADIGQVWESWRDADFDLSVGVGFGVRWSTPIGPLWADVAWPVANVGISSKKPKFYLGIGRPF
jgi:translocation and assembly module TamA